MNDTQLKFERIHLTTIAVLCLSIAASVGLITSIGGLFLSPIAEELGTGRGNVSVTMSIANMVYAFGGMLLPRIIRENNFKKVFLISAVVTVLGTFLLSFSNSLWQLYLLNAVRGFSSGFVSTVLANIIVNRWFLKKTGFISSIVMSFSGLAGALFSPIFGKLLAAFGWRISYQISAALMVVFFLPALFARINLTPESVDAKPYGTKEETVQTKTVTNTAKLPATTFALLAAFATVAGLSITLVQHFPGLAEAGGLSIGSTMLSLAMISNTASKLVMGVLIDKFGTQKSIIGMAIFVSTGFLLAMITSNATYLIAALILGFGYSLGTVGVSMLIRDIAGVDRYSTVYPTVAMFTTVSYALGTSLVGYIYDFAGSYTPILIFFLILEVLLILLVILNKKAQAANQ